VVSSRGRKAHWDNAYLTKTAEGVSWYQREAAISLRLIEGLGLPSGASIVDIGGGASALVDGLLDRGYSDVSVLDISEAALQAARDRLGDRSRLVKWHTDDVLAWQPSQMYSVWHDRAVFHFLTDLDERVRYVETLRRGLAAGGSVVMATFSPDGPEQCSGLPVMRYDADGLAKELGLEVVATEREEHVTPIGGVQPFTWIVAQ
jgi:trans-aconitate methyltransferase